MKCKQKSTQSIFLLLFHLHPIHFVQFACCLHDLHMTLFFLNALFFFFLLLRSKFVCVAHFLFTQFTILTLFNEMMMMENIGILENSLIWRKKGLLILTLMFDIWCPKAISFGKVILSLYFGRFAIGPTSSNSSKNNINKITAEPIFNRPSGKTCLLTIVTTTKKNIK